MFFGDELNVVWNYKYLFIISYFIKNMKEVGWLVGENKKKNGK